MRISEKDGKKGLKPQNVSACTGNPIADVYTAKKNDIINRNGNLEPDKP
jgi:hypothetical protein